MQQSDDQSGKIHLEFDGTGIEWSVIEGARVKKEQVLGTYKATRPVLPEAVVTDITSPCHGILLNIIVSQSSHMKAGEWVAVVQEDSKVYLLLLLFVSCADRKDYNSVFFFFPLKPSQFFLLLSKALYNNRLKRPHDHSSPL